MQVTYSCLVLSSVEPCSFLPWSDVGCCPLRLEDGGQTRVSPMRQPTGWNLDYPSTLQSLDWALGTIPCDVTSNVKSFSSKQPDVFWDRAFSLFHVKYSQAETLGEQSFARVKAYIYNTALYQNNCPTNTFW